MGLSPMDRPSNDEYFMDMAELVSTRSTCLRRKVGAVIVKDGKIIATGVNRVTANNDPTAHAEVSAIREACRNIADFRLNGCTIYTS